MIAHGQEPLSKKEIKKQKTNFLIPGKPWTVELPIWIPGFAGSFAYGDVDIEGEDGMDPVHPIEPPPGGVIGEIISRLFQSEWYLKFFFLTRVVYEKDKLLFQFDAISGAVGNSVKFQVNNKEIVSADFRTTNLRFLAGFELIDILSSNQKFKYELFGYIGTRVHFHSFSSRINSGETEIRIAPAWWEPVLGIQNQFTFKRWMIVVQGDYGGIFVNEKYSNQISLFTHYRIGKLNSIKIGWNHLQLNHTGIFLLKDYNIKATFSGPTLGFVFHF